MKTVFSFILIVFCIACAGVVLADEPAASASIETPFTLSYADAEQAVSKALVDKGVGTSIAAIITGHKTDAIYSYSKPVSVEVRGLQFDKTTTRWNASLLFVADGEVVTAMPAGGRFDETVDVPILKRQMRSGEVISEDDVEMRAFPVSHTHSDTVTDAASIIGKTPARGISALRPIRQQEIAQPAIIKKNGIVEMRYSSPGMQITTSGEALDSGAKGDVIAVRNLASKKIIRAVIADANTVIVTSGNTQTSQVTGAKAYETN